ncbi:serine/threonine-protein kinase [Urbifossiella limnaea]|uniref:tetratricopeptide repeat protein n=1 Tax=Urbifossiella limnaea TaxID=2528023 RepID=UPI00192E59CE|nr:tetratricopeptide repeat protein [Urbifossiella limnaea]
MPPEQAAAVEAVKWLEPVSRAVDARGEVFALGHVLGEALNWARVPPSPAALVARCTAADPAARYPSAAAVAADLRRHLAEQPSRGVPTGSTARGRHWTWPVPHSCVSRRHTRFRGSDPPRRRDPVPHRVGPPGPRPRADRGGRPDRGGAAPRPRRPARPGLAVSELPRRRVSVADRRRCGGAGGGRGLRGAGPGRAWCVYNRGLAYQPLGRADAARADFNRARELDPGLNSPPVP